MNNSSVNFSSAMFIFIFFWNNLARNEEKISHENLHMDQSESSEFSLRNARPIYVNELVFLKEGSRSVGSS